MVEHYNVARVARVPVLEDVRFAAWNACCREHALVLFHAQRHQTLAGASHKQYPQVLLANEARGMRFAQCDVNNKARGRTPSSMGLICSRSTSCL